MWFPFWAASVCLRLNYLFGNNWSWQPQTYNRTSVWCKIDWKLVIQARSLSLCSHLKITPVIFQTNSGFAIMWTRLVRTSDHGYWFGKIQGSVIVRTNSYVSATVSLVRHYGAVVCMKKRELTQDPDCSPSACSRSTNVGYFTRHKYSQCECKWIFMMII